MLSRIFPALGVALMVGGLVAAGPAAAKSLTVRGLSFSDELGGFVLDQASGSGTPADPFVIVETVTGPQHPVLVIRGLSAAFGNLIGSQHAAGFAVRKIVINQTDHRWQRYQLELREELEQQSDYGDGLSFAQGATQGRSERSDVFAKVQDIDEPFDAIIFSDGGVPVGGQATFDFVITDSSPTALFYLLQEQLDQVAGGRKDQVADRRP
jgi:hypothetical protein